MEVESIRNRPVRWRPWKGNVGVRITEHTLSKGNTEDPRGQAVMLGIGGEQAGSGELTNSKCV